MNTTSTNLFINTSELLILTGRKTKSRQIAWLRTSGLPYRINATGHPVVTRAAVVGNSEPMLEIGWVPKVLQLQKKD
jgi:Domain of unknown function (DUF4224)